MPEYDMLTLWPEDFHASHLAEQENKMESATKDIYGRKCSESPMKLDLLGLLVKMLRTQSELFLTTSSTVWKKSVTKRKHLLYRLNVAEPTLKGKELLSWPRPTTGAPLCGGTNNFKQMQKLKDAGIITEEERKNLTQGNGGQSNPDLMEWLMGCPIGWTELKREEMQLGHNKFIQFLKR